MVREKGKSRKFSGSKVLIAAFLGVVAFGIISFGSSPEQDIQEAPIAEKKEKADNLYKFGEDITVGDFTYNISDKVVSKEIGTNEFNKETARDMFLVLTVSVTNNDKTANYVSDSDIKIKDGDTLYNPSDKAFFALNNEEDGKENIFFTELNPNQTLVSDIAFDLPEDVLNKEDLILQIKKAKVQINN